MKERKKAKRNKVGDKAKKAAKKKKGSPYRTKGGVLCKTPLRLMVLCSDPVVGMKDENGVSIPVTGVWTKELQPNDTTGPKVVCRLCVLEGVEMKDSVCGKASSPFKKHLVSKHPDALHNVADVFVSAATYGMSRAKNSTGAQRIAIMSSPAKVIVHRDDEGGDDASDDDDAAGGAGSVVATASVLPGCGTEQGPTTDRDWFVDAWTRLTVSGGLSFTLVENPALEELVDGLHPGLWSTFRPKVTRKVISKYVPVLARAVADEIALLLEQTEWVSISSDEWATRKASLPFITVTAYFTTGGVSRVRILEVIPMTKGSTSPQIALAMYKCLKGYNILHKVATLTTDGANSQMAISLLWEALSKGAQTLGKTAVDVDAVNARERERRAAEEEEEEEEEDEDDGSSNASSNDSDSDAASDANELDEFIALTGGKLQVHHLRCQAHAFSLISKSTCSFTTVMADTETEKLKFAVPGGSPGGRTSTGPAGGKEGAVAMAVAETTSAVGPPAVPATKTTGRGKASKGAKGRKAKKKTASKTKSSETVRTLHSTVPNLFRKIRKVSKLFVSSHKRTVKLKRAQRKARAGARARAEARARAATSSSTTQSSSSGSYAASASALSISSSSTVSSTNASCASTLASGSGGSGIALGTGGSVGGSFAGLGHGLDLESDDEGDHYVVGDLEKDNPGAGKSMRLWAATRWASNLDMLTRYMELLPFLVDVSRGKKWAAGVMCGGAGDGDDDDAVPPPFNNDFGYFHTNLELHTLQLYLVLVMPLYAAMQVLQRRVPVIADYGRLLDVLGRFYGTDRRKRVDASPMSDADERRRTERIGTCIPAKMISLQEFFDMLGGAFPELYALEEDLKLALMRSATMLAPSPDFGDREDKTEGWPKYYHRVLLQGKVKVTANGKKDGVLCLTSTAFGTDAAQKGKMESALAFVVTQLVEKVGTLIFDFEDGNKGYHMLSVARLASIGLSGLGGEGPGGSFEYLEKEMRSLIKDLERKKVETERGIGMAKIESREEESDDDGSDLDEPAGHAQAVVTRLTNLFSSRSRKSTTKSEEMEVEVARGSGGSRRARSGARTGARMLAMEEEPVAQQLLEEDEKKRAILQAADEEVDRRTKEPLEALSLFVEGGKAFKTMTVPFSERAVRDATWREKRDAKACDLEGKWKLYSSYIDCLASIIMSTNSVPSKGALPVSIPLVLWSRLEQGLALPGTYSEALRPLRPLAPYMVAVLQTPIVSCEDERVFSSAAHIYTPYRQSLHHTTGAAILMARLNPKLARGEIKAELFLKALLETTAWQEGLDASSSSAVVVRGCRSKWGGNLD